MPILSNGPWPLKGAPAAGVTDTNNAPCSSIDWVIFGAVLAFANRRPAKTELILITFGSNRSVKTAIQTDASELISTASRRFSPRRSSLVDGVRLSSITLTVGWLAFALVSIFSRFGASCSTAGVSTTSCLLLPVVEERLVVGARTLLIAVATSIFGGGAVSVPFVGAAVFGCGIATSFDVVATREFVSVFCLAGGVRTAGWVFTVGVSLPCETAGCCVCGAL